MKQLIYHRSPQSFGYDKPYKFANFLGLLGLVICFCLPGRVQAQCPTITLLPEATVCIGQDINIVATINDRGTETISYTWFFNAETVPGASGNLSSSESTITLTLQKISNNQFGTYSLEIRSTSCSGKTAHIEIKALTKESIVFNPSKPILNCLTSSVTVDVTPKNPNYVYKWTGGQTTSNLVFTKAGQYGLTVTSGNCSVETSITIDTAKKPVAKAGAGLTLNDAGKGLGLTLNGCNQSFWLNSAGSKNDATSTGIDMLTYQWTKPDGSNLSTNQTVENNTMIGIYVLTVTHKESKCTDTAQVIVKTGTVTRPTANITPAAPPTITCATTNVILDGSSSTPATGVTYAWAKRSVSNSTISFSPIGTSTPMLSVSDSGTYRLIVTNTSTLCESDPKTIRILKNTTKPVVALDPRYNICQGIPFELTPKIPPSNADTYSWKVNNGTSSTTGNSLNINTASLGTQKIELTGTLSSNGCPNTATTDVVVTAKPSLTVAGPDAVREKLSANIIITSSGSVRWSLDTTINIQLPVLAKDTGGITKTFSPSFMLASSRATGYVAYRIFASANNCTVDSLKSVEILPGASAFFPEIITPNGDNQNDTWSVVFPNQADYEDHELYIFNRMGIQVHYRNNMRTEWNANGCPNGVYFYKIINTKNPAITYKGAITVLGRDQ